MPTTIVSRQSDGFSAGIAWEDYAYAIVESPSEVRLVQLAAEKVVPEEYDSGILFGREAELRWRRRRNGKFHTVLIHDHGEAGETLQPAGDAQFVLWGERQAGADPPAWYEPRIPKMITGYPEGLKGPRVAVALKLYKLEVQVPQPAGLGPARTSTLLFSRCADLVEVELEE
jgi:hypothetical protein